MCTCTVKETQTHKMVKAGYYLWRSTKVSLRRLSKAMSNQVINVFKDGDFHSLSGQSVQVFDHTSNIYIYNYIYIVIYSRLNRIYCVSTSSLHAQTVCLFFSQVTCSFFYFLYALFICLSLVRNSLFTYANLLLPFLDFCSSRWTVLNP